MPKSSNGYFSKPEVNQGLLRYFETGGDSSTSPPIPVGEVVNGGGVSTPEIVGAGVQGPAETGANVPPIGGSGTTGSGATPIVPSPTTA